MDYIPVFFEKFIFFTFPISPDQFWYPAFTKRGQYTRRWRDEKPIMDQYLDYSNRYRNPY